MSYNDKVQSAQNELPVINEDCGILSDNYYSDMYGGK